MDNGTNERHRCIIAMVELIHPDGSECEPRETDGVEECSADDLNKLRLTLDDAHVQESVLVQKMAKVHNLVADIRSAVQTNWQAQVSEDALLSKIQTLQEGCNDKHEALEKKAKFEANVKLLLKTSSEQKLQAELAAVKAKAVADTKSVENQTMAKPLADLKSALAASNNKDPFPFSKMQNGEREMLLPAINEADEVDCSDNDHELRLAEVEKTFIIIKRDNDKLQTRIAALEDAVDKDTCVRLIGLEKTTGRLMGLQATTNQVVIYLSLLALLLIVFVLFRDQMRVQKRLVVW